VVPYDCKCVFTWQELAALREAKQREALEHFEYIELQVSAGSWLVAAKQP
jgi:hypothetical protein